MVKCNSVSGIKIIVSSLQIFKKQNRKIYYRIQHVPTRPVRRVGTYGTTTPAALQLLLLLLKILNPTRKNILVNVENFWIMHTFLWPMCVTRAIPQIRSRINKKFWSKSIFTRWCYHLFTWVYCQPIHTCTPIPVIPVIHRICHLSLHIDNRIVHFKHFCHLNCKYKIQFAFSFINDELWKLDTFSIRCLIKFTK